MSNRNNIANEDIIQALKGAEVRPSTVRIHVLKYLKEHRNHPTVDHIYRSLLDTLPGLSRTSVYNTVGALADAGLVRTLIMEGGETRYDAFTENHAHFRCERCGEIFDVDMNPPDLVSNDLSGFTVNRLDLLFWGLCPKCAKPHMQS